ncbi:hypothetical protein ACN47E_003570 [Coniothyrium glycines]
MASSDATPHGYTPNTRPASSPAASLPIAIAGGGCVGLFLALLLAHARLPTRILVLEPSSPDPTCTRAMAHQPPTYPILSQVPGLLPELMGAGCLSSGLCFRTSVRGGSVVVAEKVFDNSGPGVKGKGQLLLPQGKFQAVLMERLAGMAGKVEVRLGSHVEAFVQRDEHVDVTVRDASGDTQLVRAAYLVGADGAHSTVRRELGAELEGETLDAQLVATDLYFDFAAWGFHNANFVIDPVHYGLIGLITPSTPSDPALWRVSYGVPLSYSPEEISARVHEKLAHMLPAAGLDADGERAYKIARIAPYKAQQRCVSSFVSDRVILIGDAAHLTNPYAGLGLASGMADAASLATVLVRILSEEARDATVLLQSWSQERRRVFQQMVDVQSRAAYARVKSDVSTAGKREDLVRNDPLVGALKGGMPVAPGSLETNVEVLTGW